MIPPRLLTDGLLFSAAKFAGKTAVVDERASRTFDQLLDSAARLAGFLCERGLVRGDRVAIYLDNGARCAAAIYGVMLAGGIIVVVNPQTKSEKLRFILEDSGATMLITDSHLQAQYGPATAGMSQLQLIIAGDGQPNREGPPDVAELGAVMRTAPGLSGPPRALPCDIAALIYTSGSSGAPRAVMQTHQSMVFSAWSIIEYLQMSAEDRILLTLPMAFDYGLYQLFMSVFLGATLFVERSFAFAGRIHGIMTESGITVMPGIPTIFAMMKASHQRSAIVFPSVRIVTNTAAALHPSLLPAMEEIFPNARIFKMYGLTECKRVSYLDPDLLRDHPRSVGKAVPGTEVSLHTPEGTPVAPNTPGILHVRGPHVMAGYWNQPEMSAQMLRPGPVPGEKVLVTQDWFTQDEHGLLYFLGRSDDIIKTRGEKVSPREIERVLCGMDGVVEAVVVGVPDAALGETIRAYVVAAENVQLSEQAVRRVCSLHLENYMVPQEVRFLSELPRTPNGKVDKKSLTEKSD